METKTEPEEEMTIHQLGKPTVSNRHQWNQRGTVIMCSSCDSTHAFYVNVDEIMVGIDENGMPRIARKY